MGKVINGISLQQFKRGWWGEKEEGVTLLNSLGLPTDKLPFDVEAYLTSSGMVVKVNNNEAKITMNKQDLCFEFVCKWKNEKHSFKLYREWDGLDLDTIIDLESYAVGECTRKVMTNRNML